MNKNEGKKVLLVVEMEYKFDHLTKLVPNINPGNIIILESCRPFMLQPFGDLMRDIIIAVYQENVEEIFIVATKNDDQNTGDVLNIMFENKEIQTKLKIVDYLFENCGPEFPEGNIKEWIAGSNHVPDDVEISTNVIRHHPLIPSHVKVTEIFIDKENKKPAKILSI